MMNNRPNFTKDLVAQLALFEREYDRWNEDLERILNENDSLTNAQIAEKIARSLEKREQLLKLLSMNNYDMENRQSDPCGSLHCNRRRRSLAVYEKRHSGLSVLPLAVCVLRLRQIRRDRLFGKSCNADRVCRIRRMRRSADTGVCRKEKKGIKPLLSAVCPAAASGKGFRRAGSEEVCDRR